MKIAAGLVLFGAAFWLPTLLPRTAGLIVAVLALATCAALIVRAALHVPSTTHFDIMREAGIAVGTALAAAPLTAMVYLYRTPEGDRRTLSRAMHLAAALPIGGAAGFLAFFFA
ncbi:hypothetical protein ACK8OR_07285 [Jannaschia sp. KMU-145]|uniref:hypothetical protein n=1 Tax=Jannaschia halovivens TaxID=3388667 RepID=UPI00396B42E9